MTKESWRQASLCMRAAGSEYVVGSTSGSTLYVPRTPEIWRCFAGCSVQLVYVQPLNRWFIRFCGGSVVGAKYHRIGVMGFSFV